VPAAEFFINLGANTHLDTAYGGYCVFAQVEEDDAASFKVVDDIAAAVKSGTNVKVSSMTVA
jgi:cyclophilin family peptidyl-prolyl cis-trans isomerase